MKKLLAGLTVLVSACVTGCFGIGSASADEPPAPPPPAPGLTGPLTGPAATAYSLGGAHVLGIPYDQYIRMTGEGWFPGMKRVKVDYPAGQGQGHVLERIFPGIGAWGESIYPGIGLDGPSVGESVDVGAPNLIAAIRSGRGIGMGLSEGAMVVDAAKAILANDPAAPPPDQVRFATFGDPIGQTPFGEGYMTKLWPVGTVVPAMEFRMPAPVESQYHTDQFVSAFDGLADFPDRPDNLFALVNALAGIPTSHTAVAFTNRSNVVSPQNIRTTVNSRGGTTTTYFIPSQHLPLVFPFKYLGFSEDTLNQLDAILLPRVSAGYSRNDNPATAPVQLDPVHGFDPVEITTPANDATFGKGDDLMAELGKTMTWLMSNGAG